MSGLVDYDLTMCLVQILVLRSDYSLKGSHALFDLLLTPYDDSIPIQFPFPPLIHHRNFAGTGYWPTLFLSLTNSNA